MDKQLHSYYSKRAQEYEAIYHRDDPVQKRELAQIAAILKSIFEKRSVLEIACGTGYWTELIAPVATHVTAIDFSAEVLEVALHKPNLKNAQFIRDDAYTLRSITKEFDGGLANFWFSHIPKGRIEQFFKTFHAKLRPGAIVFMCDNVLVPGTGGELISKAGSEDTYKLRTLSDGSTYEVLKNYYKRHELLALFEPISKNLKIEIGENYWWIMYCVP